MNYPSFQEAMELLIKYNLPKDIIEHSQEVSQNSIKIGAQILLKGASLDLNLLKVGGLLHDIGRWKYLFENNSPINQDFHEYETGRLLQEIGYTEFADILQRHPLGGLTSKETLVLGYPLAVDLMPIFLETKIILIADKIRPAKGICTLNQKIQDYLTNQRLSERYFNKMQGLLQRTIDRVTSIWNELESLGMNASKI